jgi:hypothetical protein
MTVTLQPNNHGTFSEIRVRPEHSGVRSLPVRLAMRKVERDLTAGMNRLASLLVEPQ